MASSDIHVTVGKADSNAKISAGMPLNQTTLTSDEIKILEDAKEANEPFFAAVIEAMAIMPNKRRNYSGKRQDDPFTNFQMMQQLLSGAYPPDTVNKPRTYFVYLTLKYARLAVQVRTEAPLIEVIKTLVDLGNYSLLAMGDMMRDLPIITREGIRSALRQ